MILFKRFFAVVLGIYASSLSAYTHFEVPTRGWLTNTYLPSLSGRTLYVGRGIFENKEKIFSSLSLF